MVPLRAPAWLRTQVLMTLDALALLIASSLLNVCSQIWHLLQQHDEELLR